MSVIVDEAARAIKKMGDEWCVFSKDGAEKLGCHPTKEAALKQLAAIEAAKHAKKDAGANEERKEQTMPEKKPAPAQHCYALDQTYERATTHEVRTVDEKRRVLRFVASDESVDAHNTIFTVGGWKLDRFLKNPVFLYAHNADPAVATLPIGRVIKIGVEAEGARKVLAAHVEFVDGAIYPFADVVYRLYKDGFLRGVSVGFRNLKHRLVESPEELAALGFPKPYGAVLEENELVELSAVPVPSNSNALLAEIGRARSAAKLPELHMSMMDVSHPPTPEWFCAQLEELRRALPAPCCDKCAAGERCAAKSENVDAAAPADYAPRFDVLTNKVEEVLKALPALAARIEEQVAKLSEQLARANSRPAGGTHVPKPAAGRSALELALAENSDQLERIRVLAIGGKK